MAMYIDREILIDKMECTTWYHINEQGTLAKGANSDIHIPLYKADDVYKAINEITTADVAEVKHGVWAFAGYSLMGERAYQCSLCNFAVANIDDVEMKYCPGCGALMDGKKVE